MSTFSAKRNSKRIGNEPTATSPAAPASHPGGDSPESRSDDMNMMSKIYASTAMSPIEIEELDATAHTIALPLVTGEVSPALAALIKAYADAVNSYISRGDDAANEDFDDGGLMKQIIAWSACSYADLAAKTALSMYELRGRARITAEAVYLPDDFQAARDAEDLMIAVSHDARALGKRCGVDHQINPRFLADYSTWAEELQAYAAPGTDEEIDARTGARADAVAQRIFDRPAMNVAELALKMGVLGGYYFPGPDENPTDPHFGDIGAVIEPGHFAAIYQDVQNLAKRETAGAPIEAEPRDMATTLTPLEIMHARWDAANAAYEVCEAVDGKNILAERGSSNAGQEARCLQLALLYQRPVSWRDAMILMGHVLLAVDADFGSESDEMARHEKTATQLALDSLMLFIVDNAETGNPLAGWLGDVIASARARIDFRSMEHREAA